MAVTDGRDDTATDAPRALPALPLEGDDLAIDPALSGGRGRSRWPVVGVAIAVVIAATVTVLVVANQHAPAKPASHVQTQAPPPTDAVGAATPKPHPPVKHVTATSVPAPVQPPVRQVTPIIPRRQIPVGSQPPVSTSVSVPPSSIASASPPPTLPAPPLGPNVLQFTMTPGRTITIPAGGTVTMTATVRNPTTRPAYLPTPLDCLVMPGFVCPQHTENIGPGLTARATFTLHAADFSTTPTDVRVGGYAVVTVKVAS